MAPLLSNTASTVDAAIAYAPGILYGGSGYSKLCHGLYTSYDYAQDAMVDGMTCAYTDPQAIHRKLAAYNLISPYDTDESLIAKSSIIYDLVLHRGTPTALTTYLKSLLSTSVLFIQRSDNVVGSSRYSSTYASVYPYATYGACVNVTILIPPTSPYTWVIGDQVSTVTIGDGSLYDEVTIGKSIMPYVPPIIGNVYLLMDGGEGITLTDIGFTKTGLIQMTIPVMMHKVGA